MRKALRSLGIKLFWNVSFIVKDCFVSKFHLFMYSDIKITNRIIDKIEFIGDGEQKKIVCKPNSHAYERPKVVEIIEVAKENSAVSLKKAT